MSRLLSAGLLVCVVLLSTSANARLVTFTDSAAAAKAEIQTKLMSRANSNGFEVDFKLPAIDLNATADGFQAVKVEGLSPLGAIGRPDTLVTGSLFVIPEGHEVSTEVIDSREQEVASSVLPPAQLKWRCADCPKNFSFDSALYNSGTVFPALPIKVETVGKMQGLTLARLSIQPIRVDLAKQALRVTTDLKVRIAFKRTARAAQAVLVPKSVYDFTRRMTANGAALTRDSVRVVGPDTMLIVTADKLASTLAPLVQWKRARGLRVEVKTFSEVGGTKEKLKEYVQAYYDTHEVKPSFLLLVGDGKLLPPFMENVSTSFNGPAASDYPLSLLTGNDAVPDLFYGRMVASDEAEARTQVQRWIAYEKNPEHAADWYSKAATIASDEGSGPSDKEYAEQIQGALKKFTYKSADTFLQGEKTATEEKISAAVNDGRSWLSYIGHGSGTGWGSTNGDYEVEQVAKLTNDRLVFLVDVACDNGSYVVIPDCFGKKWVTHQNGGKASGAVAYYGGTVSISWDPPAIMAVGIAKSHFEKPVHTIGQSVMAGQMYLIEQKGSNEDTLDNLKWYTLFGDPSLQLRTDTAKALQIKHEVAQVADQSQISVVATDTAGQGLAGLMVSLTAESGDAPLAVGMTDSQGRVALSMVRSTAPVKLTVTGYNVESYETSLQQ